MAFGITDFKKGTIFQYEGVPYRVVEYGQKVMGRGGSIVNVRIKSLIDGKVLEKTFKGNEESNILFQNFHCSEYTITVHMHGIIVRHGLHNIV